MKTKTIEVYEFSELKEKAKEKATETISEMLSNGWDGDYIIADFVGEKAKEGILIDTKDVNFSGFCSQGDGASFTCRISWEWLKEWPMAVTSQVLSLLEDDEIEIWLYRKSHQYSHEYTVGIDTNYSAFPQEELNHILDYFMEEMRKLYRRLKEDYDYQTSQENIEETAEINEWEFLANGSFAP